MFTTKLHCNYGHKYIYIYVKITSKDVKNEKKKEAKDFISSVESQKKGASLPQTFSKGSTVICTCAPLC